MKLFKFLLGKKNLLSIIIVFLLSYLFYLSTFTYKSNTFMMDGKLYSDFAAHIPLIRSFSKNWNFPPQYPFFYGEPIRYHYLFYMITGFIERLGLTLPMSLNLMSALGMTLLIVMIFKYSKLFFKSKWVGLLAIYLFLFNGSLTFIDFFRENGFGWHALIKMVSATRFTNFGPWNGDIISAFWNLNIYTNQRHLAMSFGLVLLLFWPLIFHTTTHQYLKYWKIPVLLGFILLPLFHQAGAAILLILVVAWVVWYWKVIDRSIALWFLGCSGLMIASLLLFTPIFSSANLLSNNNAFQVMVGYLSPQKTILGISYYWLMNIGLYFVLIPILLIWSRKKMGITLFVLFTLFIVANTFRLSTDLINNHKLINFFLLGMNIAAAGLIVTTWKKKVWLRPLLLILVIAISLSGIIDIFPIINDPYGRVTDWSQSEIGNWILENTDNSSQFLTGSYMYNPASLVGRIIFLDYGYHSWSMGYVDTEKRASLKVLFSPSVKKEIWCAEAKKHHLTHVLIGPGETTLEDGRISIVDSALVNQFPPFFVSRDGWRIWLVDELCNNR